MIALSDRVFGWDSDYEVLFDASIEAIRADPGRYVRDVADTFWDFLSQRYAPEPRARPVAIPELPAELDDRRPAVPCADHRLTARRRLFATASSGARPTTSSAASSPIRRPRSARESRGGATSSSSTRSATGTRSCRARLERLARLARAGPRATGGRARILWIALAAVALAIRRPRGTAPVLVLGAVGGLVLLVHALSQAPQNEFALPFAPSGSSPRSWACSAPRRRARGVTRTTRNEPNDADRRHPGSARGAVAGGTVPRDRRARTATCFRRDRRRDEGRRRSRVRVPTAASLARLGSRFARRPGRSTSG